MGAGYDSTGGENRDIADERIVFFDGVCVLCNSSVNTLLKLDRKDKLLFATLQGQTAKDLLQCDNSSFPDSILYYRQGQVLARSDAVLSILSDIGGLWALLSAFRVLPRGFRDWAYDLIAKNRYKWFGKRDACRLPTERERGKILD